MSNPIDPTLPAEPPSVPPVPPYSVAAPPEPPFVPPPPTNKPTGLIVGLGLAVVALAAVAFFVGRSTVHAGPKTLLAAFTEAQQGKLPCGTPAQPGGPAVDGGGGNAGRAGGGAFLGRICQNGASGGAAAPNGGAGGGGAGGGRAFGGGGGGLLGGGTTGTVVSLNGDQLVIQTRAGNLTITLPAGVAIEKTTTGSLADIINGATVSVASTTDSTGKRAATRIFILPAGTEAPGGPPASASG